MNIAQNLVESLKTTLLGMGIVMLTLYLLSLILELMRYFFYRPQQEVKKSEVSSQVEIISDTIKSNEKENDLELVAVITAALSSYMSIPASQIRIGSIRQIHKTTPVWGIAARHESYNNKI